ncbi:putative large terminase [Polaromonas phage Tiera]|nr:putative large terminase [Polaromonas phage Tiera]
MAELLQRTDLSTAVVQSFENVNVNVEEARIKGREDINFFAGLVMPQVMESPFPEYYVGLWKTLTQRDKLNLGAILRFALGLPRGHAKTTFIKAIIAWLIVYDKISFAVIICANQDLANELLSDVNDMLSHPNATLVYGNWEKQLSTDAKELKKALYHDRNVILAARGAGTAVRGINIKHRRPDLIFCDDAQTKENDDSPTDSLKFRKWLIAMFKIIAPKGDRLIIYVGNMYSENCMLYQLKKSRSWISLVTGAILAETGLPLWPELHSLESLMESYFHDEELGEADVWFAEVMNDPVNKATSLLTGPIEAFEEDGIMPDGVFLTIDPAGFRKNSDDNVIVVHYIFDGKPIVAEIVAGNLDPEQLCIEAIRLANDHGASLIGVEATGYQQTLMFWMNKYLTEWNVHGIAVVELKPAGRSKESRIRLMANDLQNGNYLIMANARAIYIFQAMKYKLGKKDNKDDILDACAYGLDVKTEYWHLITNLRNVGRWASEVRVIENNTSF